MTKILTPNAKETVRGTTTSGRYNYPDQIKPVGDLAKAKQAMGHQGSSAALEKIGGDKLNPNGRGTDNASDKRASNAARVLYGNSASSKSTWPGRKAP
jgi:hypothetical protein